MAIAPALSGADLREGLSMSEREMLQDATDLAVFRGSLVRLRLRDFDGSVVYSDDGTTVDGAAVGSRAFRAAAGGTLHVAIAPDPVDGTGKVIRSLQPVVATASGRAVGVLELYLPYDEIEAQSERQLHETYVRLAWGLGLLWLVLAVISWSSSRSLRRQALLREHQALHDSLTGLPNRAAFLAAVDRLLAVDAPATVVLLDLDGFKAVNDTLGHAAGDALLSEVAVRAARRAARRRGRRPPGRRRVRPAARQHDRPAGAAAAARRASSTRCACRSSTTGRRSASGPASAPRRRPEQGRSVDRLMRAADEAMYQCKRTRRAVTAGCRRCPPSGRPGRVRARGGARMTGSPHERSRSAQHRRGGCPAGPDRPAGRLRRRPAPPRRLGRGGADAATTRTCTTLLPRRPAGERHAARRHRRLVRTGELASRRTAARSSASSPTCWRRVGRVLGIEVELVPLPFDGLLDDVAGRTASTSRCRR